jgi:hypothetical protein
MRTRTRIQQRAVKEAILALRTTKRHQGVRKARKTAQGTKEVAQMTLETQRAIKAIQEAAEADFRISQRVLARLLGLESQVAKLMKRLEKVEGQVKRPHEAALRPGAIL